MTDEEICRDFRLTKKGDKNREIQIQILAQRNVCKEQVIVDILTRGGETVPLKKISRPPWMPKLTGRPKDTQMHQRRLALYRQGLSDGEIAREMGVTPGAICVWRCKNGLPKNPREQRKIRTAGGADQERK